MVLLDRTASAAPTSGGPSRRALLRVVALAATALFTGAWLVIDQYNDRPPWADDVTYEAGYLHGNRVKQYDRDGALTADLLAGGCQRLAEDGTAGAKAEHDPELWVRGCLDGATGKVSAEQGLLG
ncbi:hypothetical protein [Streptomyces sp. NPDC001985]|uniref:hypothetical protein n=1 Tax=Streptomyces sp. NPDC001985 TaxID=3154406 RepID=UPI003317BE63